MNPEQALFLLNQVLPRLKSEHDITRRIISAIPLDKGDYRPDSIGKTALELAWHIVAAEHRFLSGIYAGAFDFTPIHRTDSIKTSADIAGWFDHSFAKNLEKLEKLSADQLIRPIDFRGIFQFPAVSYVQVAMNHTIHHRGQLSMYLRPMGAKVPSIYGESYDAAQERIEKEKSAVA